MAYSAKPRGNVEDYAPGNPDYEYDRARQDEMNAEQDAKRTRAGSADADGVPALSATIAHILVNKSALHAWHAHPRLNPNYYQEESAEFDYGRAAHSILLEGDESPLIVIEADDWRSKAAKEARINARADGKIPLLSRQMHKVRAMVAAAHAYLAESDLVGILDSGHSEYPLHWIEGPTHCRARLDHISHDKRIVIDYKSAESANPHSFVNRAVAYGYAMQEAFYRRGVKAIIGREPAFAFFVQEKEPPFACSLIAFDPAMQAIGDRQVEYAISLWTHAMQTDRWLGYPSQIAYLEPPAWYMARAEEWATDEALEERMQP